MEQALKYAYYIILVVLAAGSLALSVIATIKKVKEAKGAVTASDIIGSVSDVIQNYIPTFMEEAEKTGITGALKKVIVLSNVALKCTELGIDYDANATTFADAVEKYVEFSKTVNAEEKTTEVK